VLSQEVPSGETPLHVAANTDGPAYERSLGGGGDDDDGGGRRAVLVAEGATASYVGCTPRFIYFSEQWRHFQSVHLLCNCRCLSGCSLYLSLSLYLSISLFLFRVTSFRYAPQLPPALHDFSGNLTGGKLVGICGRTGCGKSTATLVRNEVATAHATPLAHQPLIPLL